ncbi:MAG: alpha-D-ribose 1-methylphosphonate 5-triphosphate diphosphatase PhnM [Phormidesmis priestleyi Ana]|uniref:Alpha-D-ribose 1-methylphosphonate 5-triphosphate diphosphatase PhnM n=1 Tax=Phormidesmis priestleyi Ana TaxID=1666911 RepID=A0A0P8BTP8_9CYAN|nr:MAG: alpha-D-ribose 1-methylphosphonate 5-triphosphate diphosphatase PhnM [Phormidesmis priestleyi Ana]
MKEQIFTNYCLQLPTAEVLGTLLVKDGIISDIQPDVVSCGHDGEGQYLLPGLIELHTDNLERCISPRPGIRWPLTSAITYHDRDLAAAGITTVCDAIAIGDVTPGESVRKSSYDAMIQALYSHQQSQRFLVDHRLHLRCELGYEPVAEIVLQYAQHPLLCLISLMDHTPGQRQFVKLDKFREYYMGKHGISEAEIDNFIKERLEAQKEHAQKNRTVLVKMAAEHRLSMASHDDATVEHVEQAASEGANISEFPTTLIAAKTAKEKSLQVLMGAPNLILGGSHSGNVSAMELVQLDLVDLISSDYVPHSLLQSIFVIAAATAKPIYEAMQPVTANAASAIGLAGDRGTLEVGKRADLLTVHLNNNIPHLTSVFSQGKRTA